MEYSYKFRLYPTAVQRAQISRNFGCCRYVFNHFLAQRQEQYRETGTSPTRFQQDKSLTMLKRELPWLKEVDSTSLQATLQDLDTAFQNFFRRVKHGDKPGYPRFKNKHDHRQSYKSKCAGTNFKYPGVAQLAARVIWDHEAGSSNLPARTIVDERGVCMTRSDFLMNVTTFGDLVDFCSDENAWELYEERGLMDAEQYDNSVKEDIVECSSDMQWYEIGECLAEFPAYNEDGYYIKCGCLDYRTADDDDFAIILNSILDYYDDYDCWDEEEPEEEVSIEEIEAMLLSTTTLVKEVSV